MTHLAFPVVLVIWAGMIVGLSFIATPVKFHASQLTLPIALEVGRVTFHFFNIVEWVVLAISFAISWTKGYSLIRILFFLCLVAILLLQTFWLLPVLDERVKSIMAGNILLKAPYHLIYILVETLKLLFLLTMGCGVLLTLVNEEKVI